MTRRNRKLRRATLAHFLLGCLVAPGSALAAAEPATFAGATPDGTQIFFESSESLVSADTDNSVDVYGRIAGATRLISIGPLGGNAGSDAGFARVDETGNRVFFTTAESLTVDDGDAGTGTDLYERRGGSTLMVSDAQGLAANDALSAAFAGFSQATGDVFFETAEPLLAADVNGLVDVYRRQFDGTLALVSTGLPDDSARFAAVSPDGTRAYITTGADGIDADGAEDVFERDLSGTGFSQVSTGTAPIDAAFAAVHQDGATYRVLFTTAETLDPADTDLATDLYEVTNPPSPPLLVSAGNSEPGAGACAPACGNAPLDAFYAGASDDGARIFFSTAERLQGNATVPADTDSALDIYRRHDGQTVLVSRGPASFNAPLAAEFAGVSENGLVVFWQTAERTLAADTDSVTDIYFRVESLDPYAEDFTGLASVGASGPANASLPVQFHALSANGARVVFSSDEALAGDDLDGRALDIYVRSLVADRTVLVSRGASISGSTASPTFGWARDDGELIVFDTAEVLAPRFPADGAAGPAPHDTDAVTDTYERAPFISHGVTLVSVGTPDTTGARARIVSGPPRITRNRRPLFIFDSDEPTAFFVCRLDFQRPQTCGPFFRVRRKLSYGRHVLRVRAVDLAGNTPISRPKRVFTVKAPRFRH